LEWGHTCQSYGPTASRTNAMATRIGQGALAAGWGRATQFAAKPLRVECRKSHLSVTIQVAACASPASPEI